MKKILTLFLFCVPFPVSAQMQRKEIRCVVQNMETWFPLEKVNVRNKSRNIFTVSDKNGIFSMSVGMSDTLVLSAIGFKDCIIAAEDILQSGTDFFVINMQPIIYELSEVTIFPFGTYEQFKQRVLSLKLPPPVDYNKMLRLPKVEMSLIPPLYDYKVVYHPVYAINHPVSYFYKRFNREERAKINYYRFITEKWPVIEAVEKKYNGEIVARLTKLEGDSLLAFMAFCNFDRDYLYRTSEYDIGITILEKLKEFRKLSAEQENEN